MHMYTWSHLWGVVCTRMCSPKKKKKNVLRGMLGGWCVRDTSLLCTVHPLSFKHSDHCVRVDPSTSPYHCPALAPVWRVTWFFFGGPACLRFLSAAGSLWEALWASCDIRIVHQKVAKDALNLVFTGAVAVLWPIPSHSKINEQQKTF